MNLTQPLLDKEVRQPPEAKFIHSISSSLCQRNIGGLVLFKSILTLIGYLMLNPVYTYTYIILHTSFVREVFVGLFLNKPELTCLYTVQGFQVLLSSANNSIQ